MFDGLDELDVVAPFEILASAGYPVELVTLQPCDAVTAAHGMTLNPDGVLGPRPDLLIVPGGRWASKLSDSAWGEAQRGAIPSAIAQRHAAGSRIAGVCTGAMLIAAGGILRGRPAVTHRSALDDLRDFGAQVHPEARVVDDGDVLTSAGVTSGIDLALHLIELDRGRDAALAEAARIEHDFRGPVLRNGK
ncbi:DJ-1/PfpI family protein [Mycolicibacterium moriokaense]|nr:DJ-1/PfpI family protein [Mycolicibacterium moriokaense]